jgi:hypothetical protein
MASMVDQEVQLVCRVHDDVQISDRDRCLPGAPGVTNGVGARAFTPRPDHREGIYDHR